MLEVKAELIAFPNFWAAPIGDALVHSSISLIPSHKLNATDAIILRSALDLARRLRATGDDLVLCAADKRLLRAAANEGLIVLDPEGDSPERIEEVLRSTAS